MADPFEVRMKFTSQLQHLNASVTSAQKAAQYALRHKEMDEDLHSCILEQVERNNMNTRANIMYFIEHFLDSAQKDGHRDYVRMMQRDIIRVVDAVAPDDGSGAANVRVVRKVLHALQNKGYIEVQAVDQIHEVLRERETTSDDLGLNSPNGDVEMTDATPSQTMPKPTRRGGGSQKMDKRQIEQRIEEDRERHKRERENIWAIPAGPDAEMNKMWEETSDWGEDDDRLLAEEAEDFRKEMEMRKCPHRDAINGEAG
ncbi:CTD kinase subunit gamma CTK3-domain-containing protein [Emericellopsis atlantica]|uniref:CTD kinase subunit gamma CTK3-domain-containing protein n=1 Tax=Emericellopsis atlantica TaxID=2614577 RepID=A0A9P7ZTD2_9HYPO|nr:CTD kinase subunit gamma CTK3-domain-containing protein [Emericellopsis atlantica]KAG9258004.1 CTD kinase subunit gamma CTK3-domain-containing protein [Emericellopsis atlantica]